MRTFQAFALAIITAMLLASRTASLAAEHAAKTAPNILLIVADDLGYGDVSVQGCKDFATPQLDAIAQAGVRFTSGYVAAPVCAPSRAGLLTGRHPCRILPFLGNPSHGSEAGLPVEHQTIADHLKRAGYRTACLGKWHLGETPAMHPLARGFDEFYGFLAGMHRYFQAEDPAWGALLRGREKTELKSYLTFALADEACAFVRRDSPAPFFLYLAFNAPHVPLEAPENYLARTAHIADPRRRVCAAMILAMDEAIGRVLAAVHQSDRTRNTLVAFLSDNGAALIKGSAENGGSNAPLRGSKAQLWEGGVRVPFFVQWTGHIAAKGVSDAPVSSLDLLPTLLAAAGVPTQPDWKLDGVNLLPWLEGQAAPPAREHLFWKFGPTQMAVRGGDMKLVRVNADKGLFNVRLDVGETTDRTSACPALARQFEAAWTQWDAGNLAPARKPPAATSGESDAALRKRALLETATPVRTGVPNERPFWNARAVQFLYAPAFDFPEVPAAKSYRFTITPDDGKLLSFVADKPWAPLSPIWTEVPPGDAKLSVQGLDARGAESGESMHRTFHRAAAIAAQYPPPAMTWGESARVALEALVHSPDLRCWFTASEPEEKFHLYRYPAKIVGAAAAALAVYASQVPRPGDAEESLTAARRAADYVLGISQPHDAAWAYHPPTYHRTRFRDRMRGHMDPNHYMTTCGAETGVDYLDVYAATKDPKYLAAAVRIAETYARRQLASGSWLLFVNPSDGRAIADNVMIPTQVIEFLDQLARVSGERRFDGVRDKAIAWTLENPARTWNWQGQFEDVMPLPPYENLTKHEAGDFAIHLLRAPADADKQALALDLLRFAEDQFVIWADPPTTLPTGQNADGKSGARVKKWMLPCVLEQYRCYAPVCASSAKLIRTYLAAYRATNDRLHLEKARALAATLTQTQSNSKASGRYQTWLMQNPGPMWFNCELLAVRAMQELAAVDTESTHRGPSTP